MKTMYINSTRVGNGCWKLKSVKAYCERKKVELKNAYCIVSTVDYAYTKTMNNETGVYTDGKATDHYGRAGLG